MTPIPLERTVTGAHAVVSALLRGSGGIVHAFSTRLGGVSTPPFATLNLGMSVGDDATAVEENRQRFFGGFGIETNRVVRAWQMHGDGILQVTGDHLRHPGFPRYLVDEHAGYDALITNLSDLAVVVSTADCLPILIHDPAQHAVAAVHAGWRGTVRRIAARAIEAMGEAYGTKPNDCLAAIGPGIRQCCFEVDAPVVDAMAGALASWEQHAIASRPGHWLLDLGAVNRAILEGSGLPRRQIDDVGLCTACRTDLFFSHRAEKGRTGRMMNFIVLRGQAEPPSE